MRARRRGGFAFDAVFFVLGFALLAAGLIDLFGDEPAIGALEIAAAGAIGGAAGTSVLRRLRRDEASSLEALSAAAVFTVFGALGVSATLSGDSVRVAFGASAAAILFPAAALIVFVVWRSRAPERRQTS
jgi:hypothetical protein